jgi:hypothetical protein
MALYTIIAVISLVLNLKEALQIKESQYSFICFITIYLIVGQYDKTRFFIGWVGFFSEHGANYYTIVPAANIVKKKSLL